MAAASNPFTGIYAPLLWGNVTGVFGREINYWPNRNQSQAFVVTVMWKEGAEDEALSPGRYSNIWVQEAAMATPPAKGDAVERDGKIFDVVRVEATAYGFSRLILQENNQNG